MPQQCVTLISTALIEFQDQIGRIHHVHIGKAALPLRSHRYQELVDFQQTVIGDWRWSMVDHRASVSVRRQPG
jgi:hypothetical protein